MNKLIKREFLPTSKESQTYKNKDNEERTVTSIRKRWFITFECNRCKQNVTYQEKKNKDYLSKPCEKCRAEIKAYHSFIKKATAKHNDKFDYSLISEDTYVDLFTPVPIVCKIHGEFHQKPKDHTNTANGKLCCPECIKEFNKIHNKRSIESWKEELKEKAPHLSIVKHGNADSNTEKCTINCTLHGKFVTTLASIKNNVYICHTCAIEASGWDARRYREDIEGTLYFIYIKDIEMYKIGVTSLSTKDRFKDLKYTYDVIWEVTLPTLREAYDTETRLLRVYKDYKPFTQYVKPKTFEAFGGYTELLTCLIPKTAIQQSNLLSKEP